MRPARRQVEHDVSLLSWFFVVPTTSNRPNSHFLLWKSTRNMFIRLILPKINKIAEIIYIALIDE